MFREELGEEELDKCVLPLGDFVRDMGTSASVCPRLWEKEWPVLHSGSPVDGSAVDKHPRRGLVAHFPHTPMAS